MEFRERRITAQDGLSLYVRDYGDALSSAPPVLCLGGISRNARDFEALAPHLAGKRRVVCPDYRGRGRSDYDSDWRNYQPIVYLRDVLDILTALDLHRVVVIGTSMGGLLAMAGPVYGSALVPGAPHFVVAVGPRGMDWSTDGGATWRSADTLTYWAVGFASENAGWAVGPAGRVVKLTVSGR